MRHLFVGALVALFIAIVLGASARADCVTQCGDAWGYGTYNDTTCLNLCYAKQKSYGAVAFAQVTGAEGISWQKKTQAQANAAALAACNAVHPNCKIVYRFWDSCAALAVAKGAVHYDVETASTLNQARSKALSACQKQWGVCAVEKSACSQ